MELMNPKQLEIVLLSRQRIVAVVDRELWIGSQINSAETKSGVRILNLEPWVGPWDI